MRTKSELWHSLTFHFLLLLRSFPASFLWDTAVGTVGHLRPPSFLACDGRRRNPQESLEEREGGRPRPPPKSPFTQEASVTKEVEAKGGWRVKVDWRRERQGGLFSRPCGMDHGLVVHGREQLCISAKKRGGLFPPCLLFSFSPFLSASAPGIVPAVYVLHSLPGGGEGEEQVVSMLSLFLSNAMREPLPPHGT